MRKVLFVFALFLAGCQTTGSSTIGSGPITLSPQIQQYLDQYMNEKGLMFAVATDGRSWASYLYCPDITCRDAPGQRREIIDHCEKESNGVPCKIYAIRKKVVWDFGNSVSTGSETHNSDLRKVVILWSGRDTFSTSIDLNEKPVKVTIGDPTCSIVLNFSSSLAGTWTI